MYLMRLTLTPTESAALGLSAQNGAELPFQKWALTPPMGWNSWDCYGPTVVESEVKANADYMALNLKDKGWEYVVVDIRWFVENDKAGGYNQTDPVYVVDEFGRYTPALNRFPSAADGVGFRALADYVHSKGLKFGIHLMRGIPKEAVAAKLPVRGTEGITCDMIANSDSTCEDRRPVAPLPHGRDRDDTSCHRQLRPSDGAQHIAGRNSSGEGRSCADACQHVAYGR